MSDQYASGADLAPETDYYPDLLAIVVREFRVATIAAAAASPAPLFRTEPPPEGLYELFLRELPAGLRRRHDCRACRSFVDRLGGLVSVDAAGVLTLAMGGGLFPESLRAELHEVRATIEAHVEQATIRDRDEAEGCGLMIGPSMKPATLRVTAGGVVTTYEIDRWD